MLYLYADKNQIKLLFQKKTMFGQYESAFYKKSHQLNLTEHGHIANTDFFASALREALTVVSPAATKEKEIILILPQEAFSYMRAEVPPDVAPSAVAAFIRDKARAHLSIDVDNCFYDYIIQENEKGKQIMFFAIDKDVVQKYQEATNLLSLQLVNIIPESLSYFKLFEKTLRKDKKEYILYISYENHEVTGYMYDSYGPIEGERIEHKVASNSTLETYLKRIADEAEKGGRKLNRLILSGQDSESIRQDTFTKDVGVWTNPLKRIIPQFYQDYLKILVTQPNASLPFLLYDVTIGAFIFALENKQFSLFRKGPMKGVSSPKQKSSGVPSSGKKFPLKEVGLFVASFAFSFLILMLLMKSNILGTHADKNTDSAKSPLAASPTVEPTATPAPAVSRKDINVKVLNGTGTAGEASDVKDILKAAGYVDVLTGNADTFDYKTTEIQAKKPEVANAMKEDIKDHAPSPKITTLDNSSAADVVVIFGSDWK